MKRRVQNKYLIIFGIVLLILFIFAGFAALGYRMRAGNQAGTSSAGSPNAQDKTLKNVKPVLPEDKNLEMMVNQVQNKGQLSQSDLNAKNKLISSMPANSETIYANKEFTVTYVRTPDVFQVEIDTVDIQIAKTDALKWFNAQGISRNGVCILPVTFYASFPVNQQLKQQSIQLNPLPDGC